MKKNEIIIKNISLFANTGIGEYGTNNILINNIKVKTIIANELLEERANIYKDNYPYCNMICGSITDEQILNKLINEIRSSGLNAFKGNKLDFRNQLVKSIFQLMNKSNLKNSLKYGYIENVTSYYQEEIPCEIYTDFNQLTPILFHDFIKNENNEILNFKFFLISNKIDNFSFILNKELIFKTNNNQYCIGFNQFLDINLKDFEELKEKIKKNKEKFSLITPLQIKDYIKKSFKSLGYNTILKNIRGEEYGATQTRQRGFNIFFKEKYNFNFPKQIFNNSKKIEEYNGKTMLDAFLINNLIKIFNSKEYFLQSDYKDNNYKKKNNKIFVDVAIDIEKAQEELNQWEKENYNNKNIPNLHFYQPLKKRFLKWVINTEEGTSAYKNKERIHRPYKLIKVTNNKISLEHQFTILEDTKDYFKKNHILDYKDFITKDLLFKENNEKEWNYNGRQWMLRNIEVRKELEKKIIHYAKNLLNKNKEYYYIFFPIKGFEATTYKRNSLDKPTNALTTKMGISNANTIHPIFDRILTPAEVMSLFGLGYVLNEDNIYIKKKNYIPPKNIKNIKTFQNLIFTILGEAIISIVAESILKDLIKQEKS